MCTVLAVPPIFEQRPRPGLDLGPGPKGECCLGMIERSRLIFALLPWDPRSIAGWEMTSGGSYLSKEPTSRFWQNIRWESQYTMSYCSLRLNMKSVSKVL